MHFNGEPHTRYARRQKLIQFEDYDYDNLKPMQRLVYSIDNTLEQKPTFLLLYLAGFTAGPSAFTHNNTFSRSTQGLTEVNARFLLVVNGLSRLKTETS